MYHFLSNSIINKNLQNISLDELSHCSHKWICVDKFFAHVCLYDHLDLCMHNYEKVSEEYHFNKNFCADKHLVLNFEISMETYWFEFLN